MTCHKTKTRQKWRLFKENQLNKTIICNRYRSYNLAGVGGEAEEDALPVLLQCTVLLCSLGALDFKSPNIAQRHALHVERTAEKAILLLERS